MTTKNPEMWFNEKLEKEKIQKDMPVKKAGRKAKQRDTKYFTVKLPDGTINKIDIMLNDTKLDYTSRSDILKDAIRKLFDLHYGNKNANNRIN